jgi:ribonuclease Z
MHASVFEYKRQFILYLVINVTCYANSSGSGSFERLSALAIPMDYLDKVFIGQLHSDHFGDLGDFWVGGVISNRRRPLRVWGPSGSNSEYGTKYAVQKMQES